MTAVEDPGAPEVATAARVEAAGALRRLGHAIVGHQVDDEVLGAITTTVEGLLSEVQSFPVRRRRPLDMRTVFTGEPEKIRRNSAFPDSIVTGKANPLGLAADIVREGDEAVLRIALGPAFEGAPGRAHGGAVAALFDEVMGFVLSIHGMPAYTGSLTVSYRAPTPLGTDLELRARLRSRHGRKLRIDATARHGTDLIAEADGLFVAVDPERFLAG